VPEYQLAREIIEDFLEPSGWEEVTDSTIVTVKLGLTLLLSLK